jgi:hypothetical protein
MTTQEKSWAAQKFGIPTEEIVRYHSGNCYDRIIVTTKAAANKVRSAVKGQCVRGGWWHGMPLGNARKGVLR